MTDQELEQLYYLLRKAAKADALWLVVDGDTYPVLEQEVDHDVDHIKIVFNE